MRAIDINISDEVCALTVGAPRGIHSFDSEMRLQTVLWKMDGQEVTRCSYFPQAVNDRQAGLCLEMDGRNVVAAGQESILGSPPTLFASDHLIP